MTTPLTVIQAIRAADDRIVVDDGHGSLTGTQLLSAARELAQQLDTLGCERVALQADNGLRWIIADLALQLCIDKSTSFLSVPIPLFFSPHQTLHVLRTSGIDAVLTDSGVDLDGLAAEGLLSNSADDRSETVAAGLRLVRLNAQTTPVIPPHTRKITFTSGTTGTPKGVCLSLAHQQTVAWSLACAIGLDSPRHLCLLPLSTLLENLAGVYAPLLADGTVIVPSLSELGLSGSSGVQPQRMLSYISKSAGDDDTGPRTSECADCRH